MPEEELMLFAPVIAAAEADAKFQACCDEVIRLSEQHEERKKSLLSDPQMRRLLEREGAEDLPATKEEHEVAMALMWRMHRATCPPSVKEQAREICEALFGAKI